MSPKESQTALVLAPVPRIVFTILEPVSLLFGALAPLVDPQAFVSSQLFHLEPHSLLPTEHIISLQLGNLYFLLCLLSIFILNTTTEPRVVHAYILALWIADIGHIGATVWNLGYNSLINLGRWNAVTFGNIGVTAFLFCMRSAYMLGLLGRDSVVTAEEGKKNA